MSSVVEISAAIDKLDVKEQVELLRILPQHLKISLDDSASTTSFKRGDGEWGFGQKGT
jgi:hypothetical protein